MHVEFSELATNDSCTVSVVVREPGVLQGTSCSDPLVRVFIEKELDEVLGRLGYALPLTIDELVITAHVSVKDFLRCVSFEERTASEDDVEDDTDTENVGLAVVAFFLK